MADKKSPASGWPLVKGDFHSGDANSPVAVITMGSHLDEQGICDAGAALCGSCKTENLGLEKVIANVIANPNIRFALLVGTEVKGHLSGQTLVALHKGGVKEGRVVGAEGAIPFIENLNDAHIKRFQEQVEIVNIMESEDLGAIKAKINELKGRDPGAFGAEAIVVEVKEAAGGAEETTGEAQPISGEMAIITARMKVIEKMVVDIGYRNKFAAGVYAGKIEGLMIGLIVSFALIGITYVEVNKMAEDAKSTGPVRMVAIDNMVENIRYKSQILARTNKIDSAVTATGLVGFIAGLLLALILIVVPALLMG